MESIFLLDLAEDFWKKIISMIKRFLKADKLKTWLKQFYQLQLIKHRLTVNTGAQTCSNCRIVYSLSSEHRELETTLCLLNASTQSTLWRDSTNCQWFQNACFQTYKKNLSNRQWLFERDFLAPRNDDLDKINWAHLQLFPGQQHSFQSIDTVIDQDQVVVSFWMRSLTFYNHLEC